MASLSAVASQPINHYQSRENSAASSLLSDNNTLLNAVTKFLTEHSLRQNKIIDAWLESLTCEVLDVNQRSCLTKLHDTRQTLVKLKRMIISTEKPPTKEMKVNSFVFFAVEYATSKSRSSNSLLSQINTNTCATKRQQYPSFFKLENPELATLAFALLLNNFELFKQLVDEPDYRFSSVLQSKARSDLFKPRIEESRFKLSLIAELKGRNLILKSVIKHDNAEALSWLLENDSESAERNLLELNEYFNNIAPDRFLLCFMCRCNAIKCFDLIAHTKGIVFRVNGGAIHQVRNLTLSWASYDYDVFRSGETVADAANQQITPMLAGYHCKENGEWHIIYGEGEQEPDIKRHQQDYLDFDVKNAQRQMPIMICAKNGHFQLLHRILLLQGNFGTNDTDEVDKSILNYVLESDEVSEQYLADIVNVVFGILHISFTKAEERLSQFIPRLSEPLKIKLLVCCIKYNIPNVIFKLLSLNPQLAYSVSNVRADNIVRCATSEVTTIAQATETRYKSLLELAVESGHLIIIDTLLKSVKTEKDKLIGILFYTVKHCPFSTVKNVFKNVVFSELDLVSLTSEAASDQTLLHVAISSRDEAFLQQLNSLLGKH